MKIGIVGLFYGCAETLPDVLAPWREFKKIAPELGHEVYIAAMNCQFAEYATLGYKNDDDATRNSLAENKDVFDWYKASDVPMQEQEARTAVLQALLAAGVDCIWILDGDEFYTVDSIKKIIDFVLANPLPDLYRIHFKNYIFDGKHWIKGFRPPRIFWTDRYGGIEKFSWDNELQYLDGHTTRSSNHLDIPEDVAYIKHLTWLNSSGKKKAQYQNVRMGSSSYRWNDEKQALEFDVAWYAKYGEVPPPLYSDVEESPAWWQTPQPPVVLDIILRTCDRVHSVHAGKRFVTVSKREITTRCISSLVASMNRCTEPLALHIIDDHSSPELLSKMREITEALKHPVEIEALESTGNGASLAAAYRKADRCKNLIYFVEDDYLHYPEAIFGMLSSYFAFRAKLGELEVGVAPCDDPNNYVRMDQCRIVPGVKRPWRTNVHTTGTLLVHATTFRKFRSNFDALTRYGIDPTVTEETTINRIWTQGGVILFTPIPSLAFHMQDTPPQYEDWQALWDANAEPHVVRQANTSRPSVLFVSVVPEEYVIEHYAWGSLESTGLATVHKYRGGIAGLFDYCAQTRPNFIALYAYHGLREQERMVIASIIQTLGIPVVAQFSDTDPMWFPSIDSVLSAGAHVVLQDRNDGEYRAHCSAINGYDESVASRIHSLWFPCDTRLFRDVGSVRNIGVSFAGTIEGAHRDRRVMLDALRNAGVPVEILGGNTPDTRVSIERYVDVLCRSKIVLNFSRSSHETHQLKGRVFETMLCGAMLLEQSNPETSRLFVDGKEYVSFATVDDLLEKVRYYLAHEDERAVIASAGHKAASEKYGPEQFWKTVFHL